MARIIYVIGDGRSGSTIFSILLGNHSQIESVGELYRWIEFNGFPKESNSKREDHIFWDEVRKRYIELGGNVNFSSLIRSRNSIESYHNYLNVFTNSNDRILEAIYRNHIHYLVEAIQKTSRKGFIMDSSRNMGRGLTLHRMYPGNVWFIHLVRDPRGVVYSQMKKNIEQDYKSPLKSGAHNLLKNLFATMVGWKVPTNRFINLRYEDLVTRPRQVLETLGQFFELDFSEIIEKVSKQDALSVPHILDGNRVRDQSTIRLSGDQAWKTELGMFNKMIAIFTTSPFFIRYKYFRN